MPSPSCSTTPTVMEVDMRCKLFFGGLPAKTTQDELVEVASKYGTVVDSKILNRTGKKVCGFVVFSSCEEASACIAQCSEGKEEFNVEYAKAPSRPSTKKGRTSKFNKFKVKKNNKKAKCERSVHRMVSPNQFGPPNQVSPNQMVSPHPMVSPLVSECASEFESPQVGTPFSPMHQPESLYVQDEFGNVFTVVRQDQQPLFPCNMQQNQMMPTVFPFQPPQMQQMPMSPGNAHFC